MASLDSVREGDQFAGLCAIRDAIVADLEVCDSMRDRAALYLRLTDVVARIDACTTETKGDVVDEIAARRTARRAGSATGSSRSRRSS